MIAAVNGNTGRMKPTALKLLAGVPGHHPLPENEPQPEPATFKMPSGLTKDQQRYWKQLTRMLKGANVLTVMDEAAFLTLWNVWMNYCEAQKLVMEKGVLVMGVNNIPYQNPGLRIATEQLIQLNKLLQQFGMTPASRAKVKTATAAGEPEDDLD